MTSLESCSPFGAPHCLLRVFFFLASSHHHPPMKFYYSFLLLLVVLSAYSEGPQYAKPPDPLDSTLVTVYPNSSSAQLGVLAPVLPQNEVYMFTQPQHEVYLSIQPQHEVSKIVLSQNKALTLSEVLNLTLSGVHNFFLTPNGVFEAVTANCQLFNNVKTIVKTVLNLGCKGSKHLISTLMHGGEKLCWTIRILLESFQHVLKMYTWSLSENLTSVQFRCKLTALLLKQSLFKKHDFAVYLHKLYCDHQNLCFQHWRFFQLIKLFLRLKSKNSSKNQTNFRFMVVEKLSYLHLMNFFHMH